MSHIAEQRAKMVRLGYVGSPPAPKGREKRREQTRLLAEIARLHEPLVSTLRTLVATGWKSRSLMEHPADTDLFFRLAAAQQLIERVDSSPWLKGLERNRPSVILSGEKRRGTK